MKESKKNTNNQVHLYGYVNDVRINEMPDKRSAINIDVVTLESYKDKENGKEYKQRRTYHDVSVFTDDRNVILAFQKVADDLKENEENRETEGYKPKTHTVSLDGILINKTSRVSGTDIEYSSLQVLGNVESIDLDVPQDKEKEEKRNFMQMSGNIGRIKVVEDKKVAVVNLIHHYRPKDSDKEYTTFMNVMVNGDRKFSKDTYDQIVKGEIGVGDFISVGGRLHNSRYQKEGEDGFRYGMSVDLSSFKMLKSHLDKTVGEEQQVSVEPVEVNVSKPAESRKEKEEKKAAKKATSRKKNGISM